MAASAHRARERQRGAALLLVLWTALLLSVVLAGALGASRIEAKIAAARKQQFEADLALRAGLDLAAWRIAAGDYASEGPIVSNFKLNGYSVSVERSIEEEKLDLNRSDEALLASFFQHLGVDTEEANRLAAEIADWRDEDDLPRPNGAELNDYAAAKGKHIGNRQFESTGELKDVLHMTTDLYQCIAPVLTLFGSGGPPSARAMALIGKPPLLDDTRPSGARLGTAVRGATAGGVHVIEAAAKSDQSMLAPKRLARVFRVSGKPNQPFEQAAEFRPKATDAVLCKTEVRQKRSD